MQPLQRFLSFVTALLMTGCILAAPSHASEWVYSVVDGDNLWDLSARHLDSVSRFEQLRKLNNIENPRRMQPGTRIRVPMAWIRSNPVPASVHSVNGHAELIRARNRSRETVIPGMLIHLGDQIRTQDDSNLAIEFADKSLVTVHASSLIRFDHLSAHGTTGMVDSRMHLLEGRMESDITPASGPGSRFEIHTPSAISAVRGTSYRAAVARQDNASNIEVLEGRVNVAGGNDKTEINAGFGTQVRSGQPPLPPRKLLPAPEFNPIPTPIEQLNWRLSWQAIDGAVGYRIEIADHPDFDTLLWQEVSSYNKAALPDLPDQDYHLRVRAIDDLGLEGLDNQVAFTLDARPQPPIPLNPVDAGIIRGEAPELQWTESADASHYRLEVAADEGFTSLLLDQVIQQSSLATDSLPEEGTFYWRLSSISNTGEQGPNGVIRQYTVKPIPAQVQAGLESSGETGLVASWQATSDEQHYQLQIAEDDTFNSILVDTTLQEPEYAFERHQGNIRYMRIKSIESDGYESPWGATQLIQPQPDDTHWWVIIGGIIGIILL